MAELPEPFIPDNIPEDDRSFDPIPAGTYILQVIESKIEETKSGSGQMLVLTLEVVDGEYANRRIWDRLNIVNQNPKAQHIAEQALRLLCKQLDIVELTNSNDLHFKPFEAIVKVEKDKSGQYGPQNRVRYMAGESTAPPAQKAPAKPAARPQGKPQTAGKSGGGSKPWSKPQRVPF